MQRQTVPTDVTISIVNWNTQVLLEQCLASLSDRQQEQAVDAAAVKQPNVAHIEGWVA